MKRLDKKVQMHMRGQDSDDIARKVYDRLAKDYDKKLLDWVMVANWKGIIEVPMSIIEADNKATWQAYGRNKKIKEIAHKIQDGIMKPGILINEPNDKKLILIDGHTHYLALESINSDVMMAFVADVGSIGGIWHKLKKGMEHSGEAGGKRENKK
jgi:hypothetical protein